MEWGAILHFSWTRCVCSVTPLWILDGSQWLYRNAILNGVAKDLCYSPFSIPLSQFLLSLLLYSAFFPFPLLTLTLIFPSHSYFCSNWNIINDLPPFILLTLLLNNYFCSFKNSKRFDFVNLHFGQLPVNISLHCHEKARSFFLLIWLFYHNVSPRHKKGNLTLWIVLTKCLPLFYFISHFLREAVFISNCRDLYPCECISTSFTSVITTNLLHNLACNIQSFNCKLSWSLKPLHFLNKRISIDRFTSIQMFWQRSLLTTWKLARCLPDIVTRQ